MPLPADSPNNDWRCPTTKEFPGGRYRCLMMRDHQGACEFAPSPGRNPAPEPIPIPETPTAEKPYICDECGRAVAKTTNADCDECRKQLAQAQGEKQQLLDYFGAIELPSEVPISYAELRQQLAQAQQKAEKYGTTGTVFLELLEEFTALAKKTQRVLDGDPELLKDYYTQLGQARQQLAQAQGEVKRLKEVESDAQILFGEEWRRSVQAVHGDPEKAREHRIADLVATLDELRAELSEARAECAELREEQKKIEEITKYDNEEPLWYYIKEIIEDYDKIKAELTKLKEEQA